MKTPFTLALEQLELDAVHMTCAQVRIRASNISAPSFSLSVAFCAVLQHRDYTLERCRIMRQWGFSGFGELARNELLTVFGRKV